MKIFKSRKLNPKTSLEGGLVEEGDEDFERNGGRFDFGNPCNFINNQLEVAVWRTFKGQTCRESWKNKKEDDEGNALAEGNGLR